MWRDRGETSASACSFVGVVLSFFRFRCTLDFVGVSECGAGEKVSDGISGNEWCWGVRGQLQYKKNIRVASGLSEKDATEDDPRRRALRGRLLA